MRKSRPVGVFVMLVAALLLALSRPEAQASERRAAFLIDAQSRTVLYAEHADALRYPASLTKIMTLYMTFDAIERGKLRLNQRITVSPRAAAQAPSKLGLPAGSTLTVEQAIYATVTKSANDIAVALAEAIAGTESRFAQQMTAKARSLGMSKTSFHNASGLPNRHQRTTARDMATLGLAMIEDFPQYYHYFSARTFTHAGRSYANHNRLLAGFEGADGIKTGFIRASGFNLVTSAQRDGRRLVGVVMGGTSGGARDQDMARMLERGFQTLPKETEIRTAALPVPRPAAGESAAAKVGRAVAALSPVNSAVAAEDPEDEQGSTARDIWAVQVGAFSRAAAAERQGQRAIEAVPHLLRQSKVQLETARDSGTRFHRVRLGGLNEREARDACRQLKRKKIDCLVLSPS